MKLSSLGIGPDISLLPRTVNFADKGERQKALNVSEKFAFRGICEKGEEQLLECYGSFPRPFSPLECSVACSSCPFAKKQRAVPCAPNIFSSGYIYELFQHDIEDHADGTPKGFVYFISDGICVKIGSATNVRSRLSELQCGTHRELFLQYTIPLKSRKAAFAAEKKLHFLYSEWHIRGEWFNLLDKLNVSDWTANFNPTYCMKGMRYGKRT